MNIKSVSLNIIKMPLRQPFTTHHGTVSEREAIIIKVIDRDGVTGYGEAVPFTSPWYTEETIKTSVHMLVDFFIPELARQKPTCPEEVASVLEFYKRNNMAKAGLEAACWDLYAKQKGLSLAKLIGGTKTRIPSGAVIGAKNTEEALLQAEKLMQQGYQRIKVKIHPQIDIALISELRRTFPSLAILADANSAYSLEQVEKLKELDPFKLLMIEQPLRHDDILDHAKLQKQLHTPICLDESIVTFDDARQAIEIGSCKVINIKISRVGGLTAAKKIHDYCVKHGVDVWCGGMIEFGISRAHTIALATLGGFAIPGDISSSSRYWEEDIIEPEVIVHDGFIHVSEQAGIGYKVKEKKIAQVSYYEKKFVF